MKRRHAVPLAAAAVAVALALAWLARPDVVAPAAGPSARLARPERVDGSATADPLRAATGPRSNAGGAMADEFLTQDLRFRLEALLLEAGEAATPDALKLKLAALVGRHFTARDAARGLALAERYVDYRVALGVIKPPADPGDPRALRSAIEARQRVRDKYFSADEAQALFAQEQELDRFTLARLEIQRNAQLTPEQKAAALREAERELSDGERALRAEAVAQVGVAAQTAAFEAANAGERERYAQRSAQYGDAAAQRLAQLDREERDWQLRLEVYAAAQARNPAPQSLQQLRQQLFTPEEQLRIEAALALRAMTASNTAQR